MSPATLTHPGEARAAALADLQAQPLAELLVASSRGDDVAFTVLYEKMSPRVYGLVLRVLRDPAQSEEVTQEVCLEVWRTSGRFDPSKGHVMSWVLGMAHCRAVDRVRSSQASARRDARHHDEQGQMMPDVTSESAIESLEAQTIRTALRALGHDQGCAIELVYFGGYSHSEVAHLLGIPLGTAKSRIREGLRRLRELLPPPATMMV